MKFLVLISNYVASSVEYVERKSVASQVQSEAVSHHMHVHVEGILYFFILFSAFSNLPYPISDFLEKSLVVRDKESESVKPSHHVFTGLKEIGRINVLYGTLSPYFTLTQFITFLLISRQISECIP